MLDKVETKLTIFEAKNLHSSFHLFKHSNIKKKKKKKLNKFQFFVRYSTPFSTLMIIVKLPIKLLKSPISPPTPSHLSQVHLLTTLCSAVLGSGKTPEPGIRIFPRDLMEA